MVNKHMVNNHRVKNYIVNNHLVNNLLVNNHIIVSKCLVNISYFTDVQYYDMRSMRPFIGKIFSINLVLEYHIMMNKFYSYLISNFHRLHDNKYPAFHLKLIPQHLWDKLIT